MEEEKGVILPEGPNEGENQEILAKILQCVKPKLIEKYGTEESPEVTVWNEAIKGLFREGNRRPVYQEDVLQYAMCEVNRSSSQTYDFIRNVLFFPSRQHTKLIKKKSLQV